MKLLWAVWIAFSVWPTQALAKTLSLTQKESCAKFSDAVVAINAGGQSFGTGFLVSPDGYILTANHVVRTEQGRYYAAIFVTLPGNKLEVATPVLPLTVEDAGGDYAILKISAPRIMPFLQLGNSEEIVTGGDATVIGFPFSAMSPEGKNVTTKFCLAAEFAARETVVVPFTGRQNTPAGAIPYKGEIQRDIVYFEGPSVKGISGSPIISRDTGHVVGIVSTRLTEIGDALMTLRNKAIQNESHGRVELMGVDPLVFTIETVNLLDTQLANGMGSAVTIDDAKEALRRAELGKH